MSGSDIARAGRGDRDEGALGLAQRRLGRLREQERGRQVHVEHAPPFGERQLPDRLADHDAGIGHDAVELAEALDRGGDGALGGRLVADIAFDQCDAAGLLAEDARELRAWQVDGADQPAVIEQLPRRGAADAVRGAGDKDDLLLGFIIGVSGPPAFFQASMPPCRWQAEASRASCAACTAIAERSPNAQ